MKELSLTYPAKITHDDDGYYVEFLDFEIFTAGNTQSEAMFNAQEALDVTLLGLIDTDCPIPEPSIVRHPHIYHIASSPEVSVPALLYKSRKAEHRTIADVAKTMHVSLQRYHSIEKGANITLKTLKRAASALGATVEITFHYTD